MEFGGAVGVGQVAARVGINGAEGGVCEDVGED